MDEKCVGQMQHRDTPPEASRRRWQWTESALNKCNSEVATRSSWPYRLPQSFAQSREAISPTAGHCMQQTFPAIATIFCSVKAKPIGPTAGGRWKDASLLSVQIAYTICVWRFRTTPTRMNAIFANVDFLSTGPRTLISKVHCFSW